MKNLWWIGGIVLVVALLASGRFLNPEPPLAAPEEAATLLSVRDDDHAKGGKDASVTLIEYLDFECESCRAFYPVVKQLQTEYPNDLRVVARYFPLPGHRNGLPAALAVEAAAKQGKFWEMHDILYENQQLWGEKQVPNPQIFEAFAEQIGLDLERFKSDVGSQSVKDRVQRDIDSGKALGNTGTPSFFLDGKKIDLPNSFEAFDNLIYSALVEKGVITP